MSAGGARAGVPVTQRKVPFCGTPGVGEDPDVTLVEGRGYSCSLSCGEAARVSVLRRGSAPFVCRQKEAVTQPERGDLSQSAPFKLPLPTHNAV